MAVMFMATFLEFLALLLLGLAPIPVPLCIPPLPEDQKLLQVVPKDSLLAVSWFGRGTPNPKSLNRTERLAAEPEFQRFFLEVATALRAAWEREAGEDRKVATAGANLLALLSTRPGTLFLSKIDQPPQEVVHAGVVIQVGAQGALVAPTMRMLEAWFQREFAGGQKVEVIEVAPNVRFRKLSTPDDAPSISWGSVDGYLALAVGEGTAEDIVAGLRGGRPGLAANPVYKRVQARVRVARPSYRSFVNLQALTAVAGRIAGPGVQRILGILGLNDLECVVSEGGLEGEGFVTRSMLASSGRSGFLAMMKGAPLEPEELAIVPADASVMGGFRLELKDFLPRLVELMKKVDPNQVAAMEAEFQAGAAEALGVDLQKDLLAHAGDTISFWNAPSQGGLLISGLTFAIELDDAVAFRKSFATVMQKVAASMPRKQPGRYGRVRRGVYLETGRVGGAPFWFLNTVGDELPFAPSWTVTDTHLLVSAFPQMLRATVQRKPDVATSIAGKADVAGLFGKTVAIQRLDAPRLFATIYPVLLVAGQLVGSELQREGIELNVAVLPQAGSIAPHLTTETSRFDSIDGGLLWSRQGSLPTLDPALFVAVPLAVVPLLLFGW